MIAKKISDLVRGMIPVVVVVMLYSTMGILNVKFAQAFEDDLRGDSGENIAKEEYALFFWGWPLFAPMTAGYLVINGVDDFLYVTFVEEN